MFKYNRINFICVVIFALAVLFVSGCQMGDGPRSRFGAYWGSPSGVKFPDPENLGSHNRKNAFGEKVGMVYTCQGGFIDLGHLREGADRTEYISSLVYDHLTKGDQEFNYKVVEPSRYWVTVKYPNYWDELSPEEKDEMIRKASINLGRYFAHRSMIWHEIVTWYGFSSIGIFPERISAFSWEDTYSDNLGTWLAVRALQKGREEFDSNMTLLIHETLEELGVQPPETARKAAKEITGKWYTGAMYFFVNMKTQNFDVGFDDGMITPMLVPEVCPDSSAKSLAVCTLQAVSEMGFEIGLEIEPLVLEEGKINKTLEIERTHRLVPDKHFPIIIEKIKQTHQESMAMLYGHKD